MLIHANLQQKKLNIHLVKKKPTARYAIECATGPTDNNSTTVSKAAVLSGV